ncbi:MAG: NrsF family protein [Methylocella sp.]
MKTADLIRALSADKVVSPSPRRALALALTPGVAIALCFYFGIVGLRPHFLTLLGEPRLLFKVCLTALFVALSAMLVLRVARPGADAQSPARLMAIAPALLAIAVVAELFAVPAAHWSHQMIGSNSMFCMKTIPFLALAPLVGILIALRNGAPERPALAGAVAGLFAGAIGALLYATHCPDDSPLFVAVWYSLAIAIVTAIGAAVGSRLLRW